MKTFTWELLDCIVKQPNEAPKGKDIFYRCAICNGLIPSQPKDNVGCPCGNIFIDIDYFRLLVRSFDKFQVLKRGWKTNPSVKGSANTDKEEGKV